LLGWWTQNLQAARMEGAGAAATPARMPEDDGETARRLAAVEAARASAEAQAAAARADAEGARRELDAAAERELQQRQSAEQTAAALRAQLTQVEEAARRHAEAAAAAVAAAGDATTKEHHTNLRAAQYIQVLAQAPLLITSGPRHVYRVPDCDIR
jgi:hypothetical protein